jgi:peptidoglycan hydrolase-like protein with peptidoglycan-binding domain
MALGLLQDDAAPSTHSRKRMLLGVAGGVVLVLVALVVAALEMSGVTLASDSTALALVKVQPLGGKVEQVKAYGPGGKEVPLAISGGHLTPLKRLTPGEQVSVDVVVRRPGWLGWALGSERREHLTLNAPVAHVKGRWLTVHSGSAVQVDFDQTVSAVAYGTGGHLAHHAVDAGQSSISLGRQAMTGTTEIAAAARPWEKLGAPAHVSWFPPSHHAVMVTLPAAGARIAPATPIYLTFSKPVSEVLGSSRPRLTPNTAGHWREANSHTLVFTPTGYGAALGSRLAVELPRPVAVTASSGSSMRTTSQIEWTVPGGSPLRLQQLLAQAGYLPLDWKATGASTRRTPSAEAQAAVDPPAGEFSWRYANTPHQLQAMWTEGQESVITRGALMKFESTHELTADGLAGPTVWRLLLSEAIAGKRLTSGYSYVYVRRETPEVLTLWHNGKTVLTSPANTGISGAETALGTFPVFEHLPETTMSGTNPDGSHYEDPGIKWVSYFNGGDALHNFNRSSFGTPQSLGCVELPLDASAQIYPYTPIGTLVTIES